MVLIDGYIQLGPTFPLHQTCCVLFCRSTNCLLATQASALPPTLYHASRWTACAPMCLKVDCDEDYHHHHPCCRWKNASFRVVRRRNPSPSILGHLPKNFLVRVAHTVRSFGMYFRGFPVVDGQLVACGSIANLFFYFFWIFEFSNASSVAPTPFSETRVSRAMGCFGISDFSHLCPGISINTFSEPEPGYSNKCCHSDISR